MLIAFSLGSALYQAMCAWINWQAREPLMVGLAVCGVLLSLAVTARLLRGDQVNLHRINQVILGIVALWIIVLYTTNFLHPASIETSVYITHLILATVAFTVLRLPIATLIAAADFGLLVLLTLLHAPQRLPLLNDVGFLTMIIGYLTVYGRQVRDHQTRTVEMENLARRDGLTNLMNRRAGQERLEELMQRDPRPTNVAVVLLDLDHFKSLNDTDGHAAGDDALKRVAAVLQRQSRLDDLVCRWGGEEFLLILEGVNPLDALNVAQRIRAEVSEITLPFDRRLTLSGGLTMLQEAYSLAELLALVDRRLYAAKNAGRDRIISAGQAQPPTDNSKTTLILAPTGGEGATP